MKIQIEVDIFDDPEYCDGIHDHEYSNGTVGKKRIECPHLVRNHTTDHWDNPSIFFECGAFLHEGDKKDLKHEDNGDNYQCVIHIFKCDQCKEEYQKALMKEEVLKKYEQKEPTTIADDLIKIGEILSIVDDSIKEIGKKCDFDCEDRGVKLLEGELTGDCKECIHTPPF